MSILLIIVCTLLGIIALLLITALFVRKDYFISRSVIINADREKVFEYLRHLKNQDHFNIWVMKDPAMKKTFTGTDGTVGFIYSWDGNKQAGEGHQEIKAIEEGKRIETEIRFIRPFKGLAIANLHTEGAVQGQTKVTWTNASKMMYPMNIMVGMVEKMLAKDMDSSLGALKSILEKSNNQ
jgi:uncharacterized protein YndB with AHSA1/START domain